MIDFVTGGILVIKDRFPTYPINSHNPLFGEGTYHRCESHFGDSNFLLNIHNIFMQFMALWRLFKPSDVIILLYAIRIISA